MFGLFKSADKRIILINFEGLSVYSLERNLLIHIAKFSDEDAGYENFRHYLAESPRSPVSMIVDSVAEDFIIETVAHVRPFDRKTYLNRKMDQHFRGAIYRSAKIIGRETSGRRDDRVLFSAITKNQSLDPWVKVLLQEEIPIKSIVTPAYALCEVANEFSMITSDRVLLVNWEVSGIRQTFIADGKMMFSRSTPSPQDRDANLATAIIESCHQSKAYLERIDLLDYGQLLDVHIITPHLNDDAFADKTDDKNFGIVMHHNSIDMMQIDRFSGPQGSITAILLCLDWGVRSGDFKNTYAPPEARRFFQLAQARKLISVCSLAVLLLSVLVSAPLILEGLSRRTKTTQLTLDIAPVEVQYNSLRAQFPETPIPSEAMELAVRTYNLIKLQVQSPTELLTAISAVIAQYPSIKISGLDWVVSGESVNQNFTTVLLNNQSVVNLEIYGTLVGSTSIQNSDTQLRLLIDSLNQISGLIVSPISLPVEPGPFSQVSTIVSDEVVDAEFALNVRLGT